MSQTLKLHKAVVALNNAGVLLLQRNRCQEAMETFSDALKLMRNCIDFDNDEDEDEDERTEMPDSCQPALQNAWRRVSLAQGTRESISTNYPIHVFSSETNASDVYDSLVETQIGNQVCIRIDVISDEEQDFETTDINCAILLYNYGVAHGIQASQTKGTENKEKLRQACLHVFQLVESLLSQYFDEFTHGIYLYSKRLLVSLLLTRNLISITCDSNNNDASSKHLHSFLDLLTQIETQKSFFGVIENQTAAAA